LNPSNPEKLPETIKHSRIRMFEDSVTNAKAHPNETYQGWRKPEGVIYVGRPTRWGQSILGQRTGAARSDLQVPVAVEKAAHGETPEFLIQVGQIVGQLRAEGMKAMRKP
jgi:hypothetical protein